MKSLHPATKKQLVIALCVIFLISGCSKKIIGETAAISVTDADLLFLARIDTGARVTSIHALDMQVENGSTNKQQNIGKTVTFYTENEQGIRKKISTPIIDVAKVRNAQGVEYRYVVSLNLNWHGVDKAGEVNLRDRSVMTYKLLIGRNWLQNDFLVDVDISEGLNK